jgi:hypothetical protein
LADFDHAKNIFIREYFSLDEFVAAWKNQSSKSKLPFNILREGAGAVLSAQIRMI